MLRSMLFNLSGGFLKILLCTFDEIFCSGGRLDANPAVEGRSLLTRGSSGCSGSMPVLKMGARWVTRDASLCVDFIGAWAVTGLVSGAVVPLGGMGELCGVAEGVLSSAGVHSIVLTANLVSAFDPSEVVGCALLSFQGMAISPLKILVMISIELPLRSDTAGGISPLIAPPSSELHGEPHSDSVPVTTVLKLACKLFFRAILENLLSCIWILTSRLLCRVRLMALIHCFLQ